VIASGPNGELDGICQPGELTDKGRSTTLALGQRLRHLYIEQLHFMPPLISASDIIYLRATPVPRAIESLQQAFTGLYPPDTRAAGFPPPTIIVRAPADETLFPNDASCRRFAQLARAFAARSAQTWNATDDMKYLSSMLSSYMPNGADVAVDSRPRLSGIMDTLNATDAHGPATKLPNAFYDPKARAIIDKIAVEEWFKGYTESTEYRMLGIGGLMGDITGRMTASARQSVDSQGGATAIKFAMSGCHDTTLAGILSSLGAFEGENWPPFTSHIAFELFKNKPGNPSTTPLPQASPLQAQPSSFAPTARQSWWSGFFGTSPVVSPPSVSLARKPIKELTPAQRDELSGYYVRIRYNDKIMQVPGCKAAGSHLDGDTTFCTLEAFKTIVDKYTPKDWKLACMSRLDEPVFSQTAEPAGF